MVALFIALFGIIFYAIRFSSDKATLRAIQNDRDQNNAWIIRVTDRASEYKLIDYISNPQNSQAVFEEVAKVYASLPLCRELNEAEIRDDIHRCRDYGDYNMVLRIMMAKSGKILSTETGFIYPPSPVFGDAHSKAYRLRFEQVMIWINDELHKHGFPGKLLFEYKYSKEWIYRTVDVRQVPDLDDSRFGGKYKWDKVF